MSLNVLEEQIHPDSRSRLHVCDSAGIPVLLASLPGSFRALFTTRIGGVSKGPFRYFNLGERRGDDQEHVGENRDRLGGVAADLGGGGAAPELVSPRQVHGLRVVGASEYQRSSVDAACDGLAIHPERDAGLGALLLFADCVPVILAGEVDAVLVHGGWRGLLGGVVQEGARAMTAPPGLAFIGPSVGPCCYQVDEAVTQGFQDRYGPGVAQDGNLDLWEVGTRALGEVGVPRSRVVNPRLCTFCNPEWLYSHRRDGPATGRQGALLWTV